MCPSPYYAHPSDMPTFPNICPFLQSTCSIIFTLCVNLHLTVSHFPPPDVVCQYRWGYNFPDGWTAWPLLWRRSYSIFALWHLAFLIVVLSHWSLALPLGYYCFPCPVKNSATFPHNVWLSVLFTPFLFYLLLSLSPISLPCLTTVPTFPYESLLSFPFSV